MTYYILYIHTCVDTLYRLQLFYVNNTYPHGHICNINRRKYEKIRYRYHENEMTTTTGFLRVYVYCIVFIQTKSVSSPPADEKSEE